MSAVVEVDVIGTTEGNTGKPDMDPWATGSTGVERAGHACEGSPGTWEIPSSPPRAVARNEGNEVKRDGRREVGAPHCTCEAGERVPADPVEGRGCRVTGP
jgi:hypothetical protein